MEETIPLPEPWRISTFLL